MRIKSLNLLVGLSLGSLLACSQSKVKQEKSNVASKSQIHSEVKLTHNFGGWYCPDNLNGFPAVDFAYWDQVPVIDGRLPSEEEAKSEASLIYVNPAEYPNASSFHYNLPRLATFSSPYTNREEVIIVIQALKVGNDSIVGFRYLNGGNGSAKINEVSFIKADEIPLKKAGFVSLSVQIKASSSKVKEVITEEKYLKLLEETFNTNNTLSPKWRQKTNVNYHYKGSGNLVSEFANILFGNFYIQNDYDSLNFTEKFMLIHDDGNDLMELNDFTELAMVCGPFKDDLELQKESLNSWAKKVKQISENGKL